MKRKFFPLALLLAGVLTLASCLSDDTDSNITYYSDAAIQSFSLGTLNRTYVDNSGDTIRTYDNSADSTTTVDASTYTMTIDQLERKIYNTDSLPAGTDITKVLCTVSSKNSGIVVVKRVASDTLDYYSSSDSLDFSTPREFRVYSTDGTNYRSYQVSINVHKQLPDSFAWKSQSLESLGLDNITHARLVAMGNKIYLLASDGANHTVFLDKTVSDDATPWKVTGSNMNGMFSPEAYKNVAVLGGKLYLMSGNSLFRSADGYEWEPVSYTGLDGFRQLVGAGENKIYALTATGISSSADGTTWTAESIDADAAKLPAEAAGVCSLPLKTNSNVERVIMTGYSQDADTAAVFWGKIENASSSADAYQWSLYEGAEKSLLPAMQNISVMAYDGRLYAIGGTGLNGSTAKAYNKLYCSSDYGLTWQESTLFTMPADFPDDADAATVSMAADEENNVWLVCVKTKQVWKMRINRLGWKTEQTAFDK